LRSGATHAASPASRNTEATFSYKGRAGDAMAFPFCCCDCIVCQDKSYPAELHLTIVGVANGVCSDCGSMNVTRTVTLQTATGGGCDDLHLTKVSNTPGLVYGHDIGPLHDGKPGCHYAVTYSSTVAHLVVSLTIHYFSFCDRTKARQIDVVLYWDDFGTGHLCATRAAFTRFEDGVSGPYNCSGFSSLDIPRVADAGIACDESAATCTLAT
jgi:hypothetical protein